MDAGEESRIGRKDVDSGGDAEEVDCEVACEERNQRALREIGFEREDAPGRLTIPSLFCVRRVVRAAVRVQYCSQV